MNNNAVKIDKIDKKIMSQMELDSRQPYARIAKKLSVSAEVIHYRLHRLQRAGVISRLLAEPSLARLGLKTFRLYLEVSGMNVKKQEELFEKYASKANTQWVAVGEGEWDYILRFSLKNEEEFKEEVEELMAEYGRFVKRKSIAFGVYHAYCPMTHFLGTPRQPRVVFEKSKPARLKKTDYEILSALYENARTPTTELASRLRLTPEAVQYRLKKLIQDKCVDYFTSEPQGGTSPLQFHGPPDSPLWRESPWL